MTRKEFLAVCTLVCVPAVSMYAQQAISAIKIDSIATNTNSRTYNGSKAYGGGSGLNSSYAFSFGASSGFSDNSKVLKAFTAGGSAYTYNTNIPTTIRIRRVENTAMNTYRSAAGVPSSVTRPTPRDIAYFEGVHTNTGSTHTIQIKSPYLPKMEDLFNTNDIAVGIDNLFANTGTNNFNNIERIDVIANAGISVAVPSAQGFALFERGNALEHDPLVVALITSLDGNGDPLTYATKVVRVVSADYVYTSGQSQNVYQPLGNTSGNFIIFRRDKPSDDLAVSDLISASQGIGGVMVKYSDFNIPAGTTVYGYSVLANDFPTTANGTHVKDYTNTTYFPTTTSSETLQGGNDMATITGVVKVLNISGNVYHDTTGLTDNAVNGTLFNNPSGTPLYVNLVNASGIVVGVATVQANGSFTFDKMEFGALTARLSTVAGTIGAAAPANSLPSGWVNVGEAYGQNNLSGTGTETAAEANGRIAVSIGDQNITDIRFGIEKMPESDNRTASIGTPAPDMLITLNGNGSNPPVLSGSDYEDQPASGSLSGKKLAITSLPTHGALWYNGVQITGGTQNGAAAPSTANPFYIDNYDPSLLQFKATGSGYTSTSFTYAYVDQANVMDSTPAVYTINWTTPLPLHLSAFDGSYNGTGAIALHWLTEQEMNTSHFEIQKSTDARSYETIGVVTAHNISTAPQSYTYEDKAPAAKNYYRLRMVDLDGAFVYSNVLVLQAEQSLNQLTVHPNPFAESVHITLNSTEAGNARWSLTDLSGRLIMGASRTMVSGANSWTVDGLDQLASGVYFIRVYMNDAVYTHKLVRE